MYEIQKGDTLWGIVRQNFSNLSNAQIAKKVDEISLLNGISDSSKIYEGQSLNLGNSMIFDESQETQEDSSSYSQSNNDSSIFDVDFKSIKDGGKNTQYFNSDIKDGALSGKTILINSGHGGYTGGAFDCGALSGSDINEWQINEEFSEELAEKLLAQGANVVMTQGAVQEAMSTISQFGSENASNAQNVKVVSIHTNANDDKSASGFDVYSQEGSKHSEVADSIMQEAKNSGVDIHTSEKDVLEKNLGVLRTSEKYGIDSTLLELGFISNKDDYEKLTQDDEYKEKLVNVVAQGITESFS